MSGIALIDSSAWLFALGPRPVPEVRDRVRTLVEENAAAITSPILFELLSFPDPDGRRDDLAGFLSALHYFPVSDSDWRNAARWTSDLRRQGVKIKTVDALIAYKAELHGLALLHADADMDRLAGKAKLRVESWVEAVRQFGRAGP